MRLKIPAIVMALITTNLLFAQERDFSNVNVIPHQLADNLYYLEGSGGNIAVLTGDEGLILIDDQFAGLSEKIRKVLGNLSSEPVKFLLNTHYHPDHTGGNAGFAKTGAVIIAHDNVRTTLVNSFTNDALNTALNAEQSTALPIVSFNDSITLFMNREIIHAVHVAPAHTDGDAIVYFKNANVIHTGDVFRTTSYPRMDAAAHGSFNGILAAYRTLLDSSDEDTRFLPGHGVVSSRADVQAQYDMYTTIRDRVIAGMDAGKSLEQIQATSPTAEFDARWSGGNANAGNELLAEVYKELLGR